MTPSRASCSCACRLETSCSCLTTSFSSGGSRPIVSHAPRGGMTCAAFVARSTSSYGIFYAARVRARLDSNVSAGELLELTASAAPAHAGSAAVKCVLRLAYARVKVSVRLARGQRDRSSLIPLELADFKSLEAKQALKKRHCVRCFAAWIICRSAFVTAVHCIKAARAPTTRTLREPRQAGREQSATSGQRRRHICSAPSPSRLWCVRAQPARSCSAPRRSDIA